MSAEILRRAAAKIRTDQDIEENLGHIDPSTFATWLAVADLLDSVADCAEVDGRHPGWRAAQRHALATARAYLGESA